MGVLTWLFLLSVGTAAEPEPPPPADVLKEEDAPASAGTLSSPTSPWSFDHSLGFGIGLNSAIDVVGVQNGLTFNASISAFGRLRYFRNAHEWTNTISLDLGASRTPNVNAFIKNADLLDIETMYAFQGLPWLGPYVAVRGTTNILPNAVTFTEATDVRHQNSDGTETLDPVAKGQRLRLSGSAAPFILTESVGARAVLQREKVQVEGRLGLGGQHIFASGEVPDRSDTREGLTLRPLSTSHQFGVPMSVRAFGSWGDRLQWGVNGAVFLPMLKSSASDVKGLGRTTTELGGRLAVKLGGALTLGYAISVRNVPLVADQWQISNGVQISTGCGCR